MVRLRLVPEWASWVDEVVAICGWQRPRRFQRFVVAYGSAPKIWAFVHPAAIEDVLASLVWRTRAGYADWILIPMQVSVQLKEPVLVSEETR